MRTLDELWQVIQKPDEEFDTIWDECMQVPGSDKSDLLLTIVSSAFVKKIDKDGYNASKAGEGNCKNSITAPRECSKVNFPRFHVLTGRRSNRLRKLKGWGDFKSAVLLVEEQQREKQGEETKEVKAMKRKHPRESHGSDVDQPKLKKRRNASAAINFGAVGLDPPPALPREFMEHIERRGGVDVNLVIMKQIYRTDLNPHHSRLSIPVNKVVNKFLRENEETTIASSGGKINVMVIDPWLEEVDMELKLWRMNSHCYVLTNNWTYILKKNKKELEKEEQGKALKTKELKGVEKLGEEIKEEEKPGLVFLKENDIIQVWSFRCDEKLCFAVVKVYQKDDGAGSSTVSNCSLDNKNPKQLPLRIDIGQ